MAYQNYTRRKTVVAAPIDIMRSLDGDGIDAVPAEYVHIAGGEGDTCTVKDMTGHTTILTATDKVSVFRGQFREITASDGLIYFGTGPGPSEGPKGDRGVDGVGAIGVGLALDGAAGTAIAETVISPPIVHAGLVDPFVHARGAIVMNDTNYASVIFKLYRAGSVVKTWTGTTKITAGLHGGLDFASGDLAQFADPVVCAAGDHVTYTQTKTAAGVILPVRDYGVKVTPT